MRRRERALNAMLSRAGQARNGRSLTVQHHPSSNKRDCKQQHASRFHTRTIINAQRSTSQAQPEQAADGKQEEHATLYVEGDEVVSQAEAAQVGGVAGGGRGYGGTHRQQ